MISFKCRQLSQTHITPNIVSVSVFGNATALLTLFHIPCVFLDKETLILLERVTWQWPGVLCVKKINNIKSITMTIIKSQQVTKYLKIL